MSKKFCLTMTVCTLLAAESGPAESKDGEKDSAFVGVACDMPFVRTRRNTLKGYNTADFANASASWGLLQIFKQSPEQRKAYAEREVFKICRRLNHCHQTELDIRHVPVLEAYIKNKLESEEELRAQTNETAQLIAIEERVAKLKQEQNNLSRMKIMVRAHAEEPRLSQLGDQDENIKSIDSARTGQPGADSWIFLTPDETIRRRLESQVGESKNHMEQ
jgi:hypothetical protein